MTWRTVEAAARRSAGISPRYWSTVVAALLAYEHSLVRPGDLRRLNAAFFTVNGYVSVLFFLFWAADLYLQ